ncbi:CPA2 family monovalent cation:H+ antiporter-2 [Sinorhizobium kostiense]|uniref:CPA2 family monovalent cation:H+ antiporter-2 n=1 Tax=Sinorhizobium kostiense TaxID=76747 RepID=A0ABS4QWH1_9HYPH|nr:cation:proton antiporter [Sinorhizobium kostiense]MBP2234491.1 CPA2 family monovalent cation:H+ antiporter-2 [Sinorhizobium kostiense]
MTSGPENYKELLLFLATAGVIVPLFGRLKLSPVFGFLAAGMMLGPFGLGAVARDLPWLSPISITDVEQITHLAEFGVAFLLFMIALELSWNRLRLMRRLVFGLGGLQLLASTAVLASIAILMGQTPASAVVLGSALAMSSTAIILPSLVERKLLNTTVGRASFAVLLFQDLAVAPLLFMVTMLAARGGTGLGAGLLYALAPAAIALLALAGLGRLILRPLFKLVAATKSNELFVATCLLVVIGSGLVTAVSGQSMALGAFIAGLLLAETEYRRQIEVTIQPFQGLLLGLFFVSVGARLDLSEIIANPVLTAGIAIGFFAIKAVVLFLITRLMGLPGRSAGELAVVLGPGGEFALILIGAAVAGNVVPGEAGATAMVAATLTMVGIPLLIRLLGRGGTSRHDEAAFAALTPQHDDGLERVIVVGYGRVGQLVAEMLTRHGLQFLAIDADPSLVAKERACGHTIFYGDATQIELLRRCGIQSARALVVTLDDADAVESIVRAARSERPNLTLVVRARDAVHATQLYELKVTDAVPETIEASLQLSQAVLIDIGIPMGRVIASIHEKRDEFRKMLQPTDGSGRDRHAIRAPRAESH